MRLDPPDRAAVRPSVGDADETAPRYARLVRVLRERIAEGVYRVGDQLPTEAELRDEFGLSRHTVREALRRLTEQGFIERRQGSGSRVLSANPAAQYSHSMRSLQDLFQYAVDTDYEIDGIAPAPLTAEEAALLELPEGSVWLRVRGVRRERPGGGVICHTTVHVNPRFAWLEAEMRTLKGGPLYALIERRSGTPVAETVQTIRARPMPDDISTALSLPPGFQALHVMRRYYDAEGDLMLASVSHHPADRFSHTMRIRREKPE